MSGFVNVLNQAAASSWLRPEQQHEIEGAVNQAASTATNTNVTELASICAQGADLQTNLLLTDPFHISDAVQLAGLLDAGAEAGPEVSPSSLAIYGQEGAIALAIQGIGKGFNLANEGLTGKFGQAFTHIFDAKYQPSTFTFGTD